MSIDESPLLVFGNRSFTPKYAVYNSEESLLEEIEHLTRLQSISQANELKIDKSELFRIGSAQKWKDEEIDQQKNEMQNQLNHLKNIELEQITFSRSDLS